MNSRSAMKICSEIRMKRWEMMELAKMYGIGHEFTLRQSEQLDKLINEYLILQHHPSVEVRNQREDMVVIVQEPFNDVAL
ncbi:aspartyl-phosphate phosphatase Spo0E family protein [Peribacillus muralis]|uniref:aspartyl-phosphate phosphatase Spo0E family protein n=2 Tax=Peribacillus muralis TaxID=264697 RepID=UPI001F4DFF20|nr:aspartyl-phosphate phosphatase Spo0E family protein [Peribacillus muralis]MCK2013247.1 aspartyl-phosphate phosphatase Spo0E family protein [Peribacillus muralis]